MGQQADPLASAAALRERGVAENNAGRPLVAAGVFRRALRLVDRHTPATPEALRAAFTLRARIVISLAMSESELGGLQRGLDALDPVRRYLSEVDDPAVEVHLLCQIGYMQVRGGLFADGLDALNRAVLLLDHVTPVEAANILLNRGMVHVFRGQLSEARKDYEQAVALSEAYGLDVELAKVSHNLGELEFLAGNLALALQLMDQSEAIGADVSRGVVLVDRSRVLIEAGLHREADEALREAGELFKADRLWKDVGEVELARAECALLDGEIAAARRLAGSARDRFRRRRNDRWRRDAELVLLQADLAAGRPGSRLAPPALRLAAEFRAEGLPTRARTAQLIAAEALLSAGRLDEARSAASEAGPVRPGDAVSTRLHTRLVRARTLLAGAEKAAAAREIRTGLAELTRYRARFGSLDLQTDRAVHGRQLAELDLGLAVAEGRPAAVLAAAERGRAISSRLPSVVAPEDEAVADLLADLRQASEELRAVESDASAREHVAVRRRRIAELQQQLRSRSWQAEGAGEVADVVPLPRLTERLSAAGASLACFVESQGRFHAVVIGPDGRSRVVALWGAVEIAETVRRSRADLDVLANGLIPASLRQAVRASLARGADLLDERLVRPLAAVAGELVVVPTGVLGTVPWGLLSSLRGRPVSVSPSATAWFHSAAGPAGSGGRSVAVLAGPDLAHAETEAAAVQKAWPTATVYRGEATTQTALVSAMREHDLVHVAAHGQHQPENPLFSSIRVADGPVFAYEFDRTSRAPQHVVLAACELGQATIRPGDEALGLTSVLLHLGSRSVVSGVARVHDEVSAEVMGEYHRALASGLDSARALAEATGALATAETPAPFVNFGASWRGSDGRLS